MFLLNKYLFYELIEHTINKTIFSSNHEKTICKILLLSVNVESHHLKFFKYNLYNNIFTEQTLKDKCLEIFSKSQYYFKSLKKCIRQYRYKRIPLLNDMDFVSLLKIDDYATTCVIVDKNVKYSFKICDLIKIINNSLLSKIDYFYPDPKEIKNPYNNLPFDKSTLYNIYFNIKTSKMAMPTLFHLYMIEGFDIDNFSNNHETLLRDMLIERYIKSLNDIRFITQMRIMFNDAKTIGISNKKRFKLIHKNVSKYDLLLVFKPFVKKYLYVVYTLNCNKKIIMKNELCKKITGFFLENPKFGRKFKYTNNLFIFSADKHIITYNLKIKNNYNSINIKNISLPSLTEWANIERNYTPPVPPLRLLPNNNLQENNISLERDLTQQWSHILTETETDNEDINDDNVEYNTEDDEGDSDNNYSLFVNSLINTHQ